MAERSSYPSEQADKFLLRLPDGMRERLKAEAEVNKRSMNAEIVARLEASFAEGPKREGRLDAEWIAMIATMAVDRALELLNDESTVPSKPRHPRMPMPEDLPPQDDPNSITEQIRRRDQQAAARIAKKGR